MLRLVLVRNLKCIAVQTYLSKCLLVCCGSIAPIHYTTTTHLVNLVNHSLFVQSAVAVNYFYVS